MIMEENILNKLKKSRLTPLKFYKSKEEDINLIKPLLSTGNIEFAHYVVNLKLNDFSIMDCLLSNHIMYSEMFVHMLIMDIGMFDYVISRHINDFVFDEVYEHYNSFARYRLYEMMTVHWNITNSFLLSDDRRRKYKK